MRSSRSLALVLLFGSSLVVADESATLLLHNAKIYTVNAQQPWASAMVIDDDGSILAIGDDDDVAEYVDDETEVVDIQGRLVLPGFQDTHAHVLDASSEAQGDCQVSPQDDVAQWLVDIQACNEQDAGEWLLGWGFSIHSLLDDENTPRELLDSIIVT